MIVISALKIVKKYLKASLVQINRKFLSLKYLYFKPKSTGELNYNANLLVVKKKVYAPIAKICVESFIHFHPKSSVTVHVDSQTFAEVSRKLDKLNKKGKVKLKMIENEEKSWQDSKLDLILSLSEPNQFFMDADLKWNGPMAPIEEITLFVNEFNFKDNSFYSPLTSSKWFEEFSDATMKNTSFFYWGGYAPKPQDVEMIHEIMRKIEEVTSNQNLEKSFNESTQRISEQIALSLLVEKTGRPIRYLKESDGFKDGSFVESSYFGATGSSF